MMKITSRKRLSSATTRSKPKVTTTAKIADTTTTEITATAKPKRVMGKTIDIDTIPFLPDYSNEFITFDPASLDPRSYMYKNVVDPFTLPSNEWTSEIVEAWDAPETIALVRMKVI